MTRRDVAILALLLVLVATLEIVFGVNETGGVVAFVLFIFGWSGLVSLALGKLIRDMRDGP